MTISNLEAPVEPAPAVSDSGAEANDPTPKTVSYETYLKTLNEAKKAKQKLTEIDAADKARSDAELARQGEYQKLVEQRDAELVATKNELTSLRQIQADQRKMASVLDLAGGDIDPKWYSLIPYDQVVINPDTGEVDKLSAAKVVAHLKKDFPEIIRMPNAPRLPSSAPQGTGKITRSAWLDLPVAEMKKYKLDQITD